MAHEQQPAAVLAILFWYHNLPEVCLQRLRDLRCLNPNTLIFGLYGGEPERFGDYAALDEALTDNWCSRADGDADRKRRNSDQLIIEWFDSRGCELDWDSLAIIHWDVVSFAPFNKIFAPLRVDDVYFPGLRPISEVASFWWCVKPNTAEGDSFQAFERWRYEQGFIGKPWACQLVKAVLPRRLRSSYATSLGSTPGFLEYKLPTHAKAFGFRSVEYAHLRVDWDTRPERVNRVALSARKAPISSRDMMAEVLSRSGARLFHPVHRAYRHGRISFAWATFTQAASWRLTRVRELLRQGSSVQSLSFRNGQSFLP